MATLFLPLWSILLSLLQLPLIHFSLKYYLSWISPLSISHSLPSASIICTYTQAKTCDNTVVDSSMAWGSIPPLGDNYSGFEARANRQSLHPSSVKIHSHGIRRISWSTINDRGGRSEPQTSMTEKARWLPSRLPMMPQHKPILKLSQIMTMTIHWKWNIQCCQNLEKGRWPPHSKPGICGY